MGEISKKVQESRLKRGAVQNLVSILQSRCVCAWESNRGSLGPVLFP